MTSFTDIVFLSHGGGPLPLLGDPAHAELVASLTQLASELPRPDAILLVSAHWEETEPTLTSGARPGLIYDYYGFPPESYQIEYPCPGAPALAQQVQQALHSAGLPCRLDDNRGFDHGMFVPLKLMYPGADIPCVQLSLASHMDAGFHLAMGQALRALKGQRLLVIGSGFSFHNMHEFFTERPEANDKNRAFEHWLTQTCTDPALTEEERKDRLVHWEQAPYARFCHPREEHLLPLHLCYGLAGRACDQHLSLTILHKQAGLFCWFGDTGH
ncbi:DODA-type extradiol aromatic ring-opening family dioxygenase [Oceanimonas baumannii]|uniref:Dioxygenase n=1 Tax=Oceanimonas baumannii TaxID=129578 RepID=A0A235CKS5_9GAMM|nr:class III extradiol ring-cleavage dioxygenase [Oceanimonas baumannii]OYD25029.1 dioxygenase [Oceanimonas baumannii]TDW59806.1 aromatic ring-opening dioxygenase catalytic subunit (LigB family) [Oceanimonas baumannii]